MREPSVQRLYPEPASLPLRGLYLDEVPSPEGSAGRPFVYANFVSSLDGRIALSAPHRKTHQVPAAIANARDWRLYQELGAQADALITSARYFRQYAAGEAQDSLPVGGDEAFADLRQWRLDRGLPAQPDIAVLSASLDIPLAAVEAYRDRRIHLFTGEDADPERLDRLEKAGVDIHFAGPGLSADGDAVIRRLGELGYGRIYAIAGPSVFHTLLRAGRIDRLYLSLAQRLLGGEDFDTLLWGSQLDPPVSLGLRSLYLDTAAPTGAGQLLCSYDVLEAPQP